MSVRYIVAGLIAAFSLAPAAQAQNAEGEPEILVAAERMPYPLLASCSPDKHPGWTEDSVRQCAEQGLLRLVSRNIAYPDSARAQGLQGVVVTSFVIEKDGDMSRFEIVKDIGGGCGHEALRVLRALREYGLRWAPGLVGGEPVRMRYTLPLRFKIEEPLPYYENERGVKVYTNPDTPVDFKGGFDSLAVFVVQNLDYPEERVGECKTGVIEMGLLILPNGNIQVEQQLDFNNLGFDFQFEAIRLVRRTSGRWVPATWGGEAVAATYPLRVVFRSEAPQCKAANELFDRAMILADEGVNLLEADNADAALQKWNEALRLQPDNTELLYYRATVLLNQNKREEACADLLRIKEMLGITWFETMLRVVCGG